MNFLNPAILLGLSLAALPIIIHLFTRAKSKTIQFGTLRFLKELQQKQIRRLKLRQLLLLLLRTLIIALLVLGFARPSLKSTQSGNAGAKTAMAIIFDTSYSMEADADLMAKAEQAAKSILSLMIPGDQVFILSSSDSLNTENSRSFHSAEEAIAKIHQFDIQNKAASLSDLILSARQLLLHSDNINKELYIISDFQKSSISDTLIQDKAIRIYSIPVRPQHIHNLAVDKTEFITTIIEQNKPITIQAQVSNSGSTALENSLVQVFINGQRVAQTTMDVAANSSVTEKFHFQAEKSGLNSGYIQLEDDDILRDNRSYFTFKAPEQIKVALFTENPFSAHYLKMAVDPATTLSNLNINDFSADRASYTDFSQYDVVFLSGLSAVNPQATERLQAFVESGGGLIVAVNNNSDLDLYNSQFMPAFGLPLFTGTLGQTSQTDVYFSIRDVDFQHPIFTGVFHKQNTQITRPLFFYAAQIEPVKGVHPIMTFSNGSPFLFEKSFGQGTVLFFTSGFAKQDNDLPLRTLFAPLITRSIVFSGAVNVTDFSSLHIGDEIQARVAFAEVAQTLEIFRPDETFDRLSADVKSTAAFITYTQTDEPGIYQLEAEGKAIAQWAVNIDTKESQLQAATDKDVEAILNSQVLDYAENFTEITIKQRYGTELWFYFICAALLLLVAEMFIYRENKTKIEQEV